MKMLQVKGHISPDKEMLDEEKDRFKQAATLATQLLVGSVNNKGPSLPPWVPLVCVAPVCPQGITCRRPRKV